VKSSQ
jgi:hypothetical protein